MPPPHRRARSASFRTCMPLHFSSHPHHVPDTTRCEGWWGARAVGGRVDEDDRPALMIPLRYQQRILVNVMCLSLIIVPFALWYL